MSGSFPPMMLKFSFRSLPPNLPLNVCDKSVIFFLKGLLTVETEFDRGGWRIHPIAYKGDANGRLFTVSTRNRFFWIVLDIQSYISSSVASTYCVFSVATECATVI